MSDMTFVGARLRLARGFNGLSQSALAELCGVTHQYIASIEKDQRQPGSLLLEALADTLGFRPGFFYGRNFDEYREDEVHFRKRATTPVSTKTLALSHGSMFGILVDYLDSALRLPKRDVPEVRVRTVEDVEHAAERCRMVWGLGIDVPIKNVVRAVENAGVVVTHFHGLPQKLDAFSRSGNRDVIVLNIQKGSASRSRFDVAHECGHLVMHGGMVTGDKETEEHANRFASALLMPRAGFVREFPRTRTLDWDAMFRLKERWGASVAAIVRRAFDLRLIPPSVYQRAYKHLAYRGWHKGEPLEPDLELPEIIPTCINLLPSVGRSVDTLCMDLGWMRERLSDVASVPLPVTDPDPDPAPLAKVIQLKMNR
jgi:Zn-dependent peptidase ImmA (M78 family)/transcriptional regulator with XRE-family HTH domain